MNHEESLARLDRGNECFVKGDHEHPRLDEEIRQHTFENGQNPFVAVLSCADSRGPIEYLFDQGIGDIFSVRNAGNVCGDNALGTLEIGVYKFDIPLIVVLGHTDCGAIKLAVDEKKLGGVMDAIIDKITPVVHRVRETHPDLGGRDFYTEVTKANAQHVGEELLAKSELLRDKVKQGKLRVIAGLHHLHSGKVDWL